VNLAESPRTLHKAWIYFWRSMRLKCPTCGEKSLFLPWRQVRSLHDWFTPLDGCSQCGYAYDREPGYFLMAIWGVNYGVIGLGGMSLYFILRTTTEISPFHLFLFCVMPAPFLSVLFARHAKSMFLALDHFFDPHLRNKKNRKTAE